MALLEVTNIKKIYSTRFGGNKVQALSNVTFSVEEGEFVAIMGESGSGKTTLLNILASLDRPTSGEVLLEGKNIVHLTEKEISAFRRKNLGFVFQDFNLLDTFPYATTFISHSCLPEKITAKWSRRSDRLQKHLELQSFWTNFHMKFPAARNNVQLLQEH